ncbi:MAG: bifunctional diguanylate cyclase/phosphodiesterase [Rhodospirillales bacterium]|nr:MAG: bifunctional diguanylate cyclase/phosphodiesterase [Rhodospirillales bacterium]
MLAAPWGGDSTVPPRNFIILVERQAFRQPLAWLVSFSVTHSRDGLSLIIESRYAQPSLSRRINGKAEGGMKAHSHLASEEVPAGMTALASDLGETLPVIAFRREMAPGGTPRYSWFSPAANRFLGVNPEATTPQGVPAAVHWADRDGLAETIRNSAEKLEISREAFRIVTPSGAVAWLEGAARPERQPDGGVVWQGLWIDVSEGKRAEHRLDLILGHASDGIILIDEDGAIQLVNRAAEEMFGYAIGELLGKSVECLMEGKDRKQHPDHMRRYLTTGEAAKMGQGPRELMARRKNGTVFLIDLSVSEVRSEGKRYFIGIGRDISQRKATEAKLEFLAYHDALTGLSNLARFREIFEALLSSRRESGEPLNLLSLGIDGFSFINTTLGHHVGDAVLKSIALRLITLAGPEATVARVGGDRFLALLPDAVPGRLVSERVERISRGMKDPLTSEGQEFELSASIGVAVWPRDADGAETLIRYAEAALEQAKAIGPGTVHVFTRELGEKGAKALSLQSRIRRAIENQEFTAHYQPQVDLQSGAIVGMEALVRWFTPEGPISPVEFIPVAEEFGLIDPISEVVVMAVCRQQKEWWAKGITCVPVAVNISWRQFKNPRRLLATLDEALNSFGVDPGLLEIELTESSAMQDIGSAIATIKMLNERGLNCAIDDFGTGYSSLSALKRFPIRKLKVDRSFVIDIDNDPNDAAIVNAIIAMAHALKLKVVAEGVETQSHLNYLRSLHCDQLQGYLFSPPLAAEKIEGFLKEGKRLEV